MNTDPNNWTRQFADPSRGVVLGLGGLGLSVSVSPAFWLLPLMAAFLFGLAGRSTILSPRATPRFIASTALFVVLLSIPRGSMSLSSPGLTVPIELVARFRAASTMLAVLGLVVTAYAAWRIIARGSLGQSGWTLILVWLTAAVVVPVIVDKVPWIDVWHLHKDAAVALSQGVTPYANRSIPNPMSWFPEGSVFDGYVYPPVVLFTYPVADLVLGDSRWLALAAGVVLWYTMKLRCNDPTSQALAVLLLMVPGWTAMAQLAWIEVLSLSLLALALTTEKLRLRALLVGLFIASKQYLLLWALPTALSWIRRRPGPLTIAGLTALLAYGIGLAFGADGYIKAVFVFHLSAPTADLGSGLPGLARMFFQYPLTIPGWLSIASGAIAGSLVVLRNPRSDATLVLAGTVLLYVTFLTGSQAFPNYWYLVLGCLTLVVLQYRAQEASVPGAVTAVK